MINASKKFKEKLKRGANIVNYADITLSDGTVLHLEPKDFMIGGCTIEDKTTDGKFGVGFVIGKTATLRIANHDERFSQYDFYNSVIYLYVALVLDDGTIEKIRKGVYYTLIPETPGNVIEISAVDGMHKLDVDYASSSTQYPATLQTIISDACLACGVPVGFRQFDNMLFVVQAKPENVTYRQVVSYACQIAGYNARIDNDGYMQLIWYNTSLIDHYNLDGGDFKNYPHNTIIDGGNFKNYGQGTKVDGGMFTDKMPEHIFRIKNLMVSTDDVQITGVKVFGDNETYILSGEDGYVIEVKNPFAEGKERDIADYLGSRMIGIAFRPLTADVLNNPLYEPFDIVRVSDQKENVYASIINAVSYKIGGFTTVSCQAEDPVRNGRTYFSDAAKAVAEARKNAENKITEYDKAVQNMNQLAANTLGFYYTEIKGEDESIVAYRHDKPKLQESKVVYKSGIDGFFVTQQYTGNDTTTEWISGFDGKGNAVLNILYAIGIKSEWINTRGFTAKNDDGKVTFKIDEYGNVSINANTLTIAGSDAATRQYVDDRTSKLTENQLNDPINLGPENWIISGITAIRKEPDPRYGNEATKLVPTKINAYIENTQQDIWVDYQSYKFSIWLKADSAREVNFICGYLYETLKLTTEWKLYSFVMTYNDANSFLSYEPFRIDLKNTAINSDIPVYIYGPSITYAYSPEETFNLLTNNGAMQGIFIDDLGQLVINGRYIRARGLSVRNSNNVKTFDIDESGNVSIAANSFSLISGNKAQTLDEIAGNAARSALNMQTQREAFNKLTNGGSSQGIFLGENGQLYINAQYLSTGVIADKAGKNYWNLDTGDFVLSQSVKVEADDSSVREIAGSVTKAEIAKLGQSEIWQRLTNNGTAQGIALEQGQLYINGEYMQAKGLSVINNKRQETLYIDNEGNITIKAYQLSWESLYSSMSPTGFLECKSADISGVFRTKERYGNYYKETKIEQGVIKGFYGEGQYGLLDLSAQYEDELRHVSLKGFDRLHLQSDFRISLEIGGKYAIRIDNNAIMLDKQTYFYGTTFFDNQSVFRAQANFDSMAVFYNQSRFDGMCSFNEQVVHEGASFFKGNIVAWNNNHNAYYSGITTSFFVDNKHFGFVNGLLVSYSG